MIYDRVLTLAALDKASSPLSRRLLPGVSAFYAPREVFSSRYWAAQQAGVTIDTMAQLPGWIAVAPESFAVLEDGLVYRITRHERVTDEDGLPATVLSLQREDDKYDIVRAGSPVENSGP